MEEAVVLTLTEITVDWFHVVQLFTKAVDDVRKAEARNRELDGAFSKGAKPPKHKHRLRRFMNWRVRHMRLGSYI